jgi:hypothetical protein
MTAETRQAAIEAIAKQTAKADSDLDKVAADRDTDIKANAVTGAASSELGTTARSRTAIITADALTAEANRELDAVANKPRTAKIRAIQQVAGSGAYSIGAGNRSAANRDARAGGASTATTVTRVVNIYTQSLGVSELKRALSDYDIRQGRRPGAPLAVAW